MSYNDKFYDKEHGNESPEAIKADIERTRQDMGSKIDRIQNRLSPENLKVQAQDAVRTFVDENTESVKSYLSEHSKELGAGMARAIKRNPIPSALVGLGLGWLLVESLGSDREEQARAPYYRGEPAYRGEYGNPQEWQRSSGAPSDYPYGYESTPYASQSVSSAYAEQYRYNSPDADYAYQGQNNQRDWRNDKGSDVQAKASGLAHQAGEQLHEASDKAQAWGSQVRTQAQHGAESITQQAQDYAQQARQQAGELGEQAQQYASQARQQVNHLGEQVQQQAAYVGEQAGYYAQRAGEQAQRSLEENPLIFGGVALAIGALVGLALPQTRRENEMMGQWRDEVVHSAQDVAQDALQRAEQVIEEVRPELEQTAKKVADDLKTSGAQAFADLKETGRQALNEAKQTGQEAVAETKQTMQKAEDRAKTEAEKSAELAKDKAQNLTSAKA